ncbi:WRKY transcription factor SUSIBA2-like [Aristolochia californica]|uniref:WRKY transcription factor SUSIBA2-like n=1 Tax=Aristolochia californica TaxID=171875 RepID=UPI0035E1E7C7
MDENVRSESLDPRNGAPVPNSSPSELRFDGFRPENSEISALDGASADDEGKREQFCGKPDFKAFPGVGSNAARYKTMSPARLPITRSPCLTIPPGLSPTTLLDSPVLLSNMKAEPSPTTGTFSMPQLRHDARGSESFSSPRDTSNSSSFDEGSPRDFEFKPHVEPLSNSVLSSLCPRVSVGSNFQQGKPFSSLPSVNTENVSVSSHDLTLSVTPSNPAGHVAASRAGAIAEIAADGPWQNQNRDNGNHVSQSDQRGHNPLVVVERSSEDGFNWRKYGQKLVKGSEFPRSYYKCTHPNCQVKKQLERSHDGQVTDIIYKGKHDHPKPLPSRRLAVGTILSGQGEERSDAFSSLITDENPSSLQGNLSNHVETSGTPERFPISVSDDDMEGARPSKAGNDIDDEDDPEAKRRKTDLGSIDVSPLGKVTREPRVVVQTLSEVDILDDGYRWRKYGQKVVKGNPNPRSYYKCTNAGCPVRKHVERASHDPKAVITTYEGKHNHDVPSSRSSTHDAAGPVPLNDAGVHNTHLSTALDGLSRADQSGNSGVISLDLGVGISSNSENRYDEKQLAQDTAQIQCQNPIGGMTHNEVIHTTTVSSYYGGRVDVSDCIRPREDQGESFTFNTPSINHSSNLYLQNIGRLVMGP